jgi:CheY-like chemotaxis protein
MVVVRVQDNGMGISADTLPQIWELFSQGDQTLARSHGGLGIGLAVVRRIVEMHGGIAEAQSAGLGQGAEFIVRLPQILDSSAPGNFVAGAVRPPESVQRRILLVDDNVDSARTLGRLLERQGHSVLVVHEGVSALSAAAEYDPDTVLLDIGLPGMDGYAIARQLRSRGFSKTLIIAISGYGQEQDRTESKAAGFDHHLLKPVDFPVLTSLLAP